VPFNAIFAGCANNSFMITLFDIMEPIFRVLNSKASRNPKYTPGMRILFVALSASVGSLAVVFGIYVPETTSLQPPSSCHVNPSLYIVRAQAAVSQTDESVRTGNLVVMVVVVVHCARTPGLLTIQRLRGYAKQVI